MSKRHDLTSFSGSARPNTGESTSSYGRRLVSLDAYRGFIMTMLAANGFGVAGFARLDESNPVWTSWDYGWWQGLSHHFNHPAWESIHGLMGVSFWDLIQPSFMFMVGVAMPFSYARREKKGNSNFQRHVHAILRAIILVLMGVFLYSLKVSQTNWIFTNVLAQIGLGYYFAYLLLGRSRRIQIAAFVVILVGYWAFFKLHPPAENYDFAAVEASVENEEVYLGAYLPWSKNGNAAHFADVWLLNQLRSPADDFVVADAGIPEGDADTDAEQDKQPAASQSVLRRWWFSSPERFEFNKGGYQTLNFIPSIATTLLGIMCGQLLLVPVSHRDKLMTLLLSAVACVALGVFAHHTVCPIVKKIWTPSWVLFSGGYTIGLLALFYVLFDVLPFKKMAFPLVVIGMNSMVIYLMGQMLRPWVTEQVVQTHFGAVLTSMFGKGARSPTDIGALVLPTATFLVFWLVAYWMYARKYFVRV